MRWYTWQNWSKFPKLYGLHENIMRYCIEKLNFKAEKVAFDVPVGSPRPFAGSYDKQSVEAWNYQTSHRIDALVKFSNYYELWEIKPEADLSALGQTLLYYDLFTNSYPTYKPLYARLVTIDLHNQIEKLCNDYGIKCTKLKMTDVAMTIIHPFQHLFDEENNEK